jgi:hypothetical protein
MTTVLGEYRRAAFCCSFVLWAKGFSAQDIHKDMFPDYDGKCLSRFAADEVEAEVAKTTVRRLLC